jgi:quercetin dioxygenase-like cupin family protein
LDLKVSAGIVRHASSLIGSDVGDGVKSFEIVPPGPYAEAMFAHQYVLDSGSSYRFEANGHDLYFYVLEGAGSVTFDDLKFGSLTKDSGLVEGSRVVSLAEGSAISLFDGESLHVQSQASDKSEEKLQVLAASIPSPVTPWANHLKREIDPASRVATTRLGAAQHQAATGDRQFEVLFDASNGSRGATLFVGFIPSSGAPQHYHLYDELCVIVRGNGALASPDGSEQKLVKGSAFHVSPRLLHAIHNPNVEDLWILGLFRPEGSASAAFYPDGRPAPVNPVR